LEQFQNVFSRISSRFWVVARSAIAEETVFCFIAKDLMGNLMFLEFRFNLLGLLDGDSCVFGTKEGVNRTFMT
jgi:hypothetical protein